MTLAPTERFSNRASFYSSYRPSYPEATATLLLEATGPALGQTVADIGSGTGISSRLFLERGCQVYAVEPNEAMRNEATQSLSAFPNFHSIPGTAEATTLPGASVGLVIAATAFHWFDPIAARHEFQRILQPNGWAALLWNRRDHVNSPFLAAYNRLLLDYSPEYSADWSKKKENFAPMSEAFFAGHQMREAHLPHSQFLNWEALQGRLLSASYAPLPGNPNYEPMLERLRSIYEDHQLNGQVDFLYDTCIYYAQIGQ